ncbi:hypothetical protein P8A18_33025 [Streptomyces castrisilvae]|uniref:Uncharacterized protein n=1 Tax=Streptomyces castrisilvae TaxID=3033811 RepID=A0ABY9HTS4_9ACTN|nr:hypothetical protein [Streptomyces sp. Mut1]WLQ37975.1 hypothetical protein P8A18_33025 [Streptomyces sp. Mut1]
MSNSYALPILRTSDLAEAVRVVEVLLEIADLRDLEVDYEAAVSSPNTLKMLLELLPYARWYARDGEITSSQASDESSMHLPLRLRALAEPPETVHGFTATLNGTPATVRWDFMGWPAAPEIGMDIGGARGAFVTLCINLHDLELEEPASDHTVYVHVKYFETQRAHWLAEQVGLQVIGDGVEAPY